MSVTEAKKAPVRNDVPSREAILGRIRELRPLFEANAARTESDRRVVERNQCAARRRTALRSCAKR